MLGAESIIMFAGKSEGKSEEASRVQWDRHNLADHSCV